jgi:hypothetical protein
MFHLPRSFNSVTDRDQCTCYVVLQTAEAADLISQLAGIVNNKTVYTVYI